MSAGGMSHDDPAGNDWSSAEVWDARVERARVVRDRIVILGILFSDPELRALRAPDSE